MLIVYALATYFTLKGANKLKTEGPPSPEQATQIAQDAIAIAGVGPDDDTGSPVSLAYSDDDDEDDHGQMTSTVRAVREASQENSEIGVDMNETADTGGGDSALSAAWRPPVAGSKYNRVLDSVWDDVLDVDYISPSPDIQFRFRPPPSVRQDNQGSFNNQPWARNLAFQSSDPTAHFQSDPSDPMVPDYDQDSEDE